MDKIPVMVITGTSKGIGRGMAEYFVNKGYSVAGCSRGPATLHLEGYQHTQLDVGNEQQVREWIRAIRNFYQRIDVLVCNAGLVPVPMLLTMTPGHVLEPVMRTNLMGTFFVCREVAKLMMLQEYGRIITVSSMAVGLHMKGTSAYSASKSAVVEMTKILARELASRAVTCNVIMPSMIMTEAVDQLGDSVIARALEELTIKRKLTLEEICNVIKFFAAPESICITGQVIQMGLVS